MNSPHLIVGARREKYGRQEAADQSEYGDGERVVADGEQTAVVVTAAIRRNATGWLMSGRSCAPRRSKGRG